MRGLRGEYRFVRLNTFQWIGGASGALGLTFASRIRGQALANVQSAPPDEICYPRCSGAGLAVAATSQRYAAATVTVATVAVTTVAVTTVAVANAAIAIANAAVAASKACAASKAAASTATTSSASSTATAAAAAATSDELYAAGRQCSAIFFVEDIERRQADVGDFLFGESNFVAHSSVRRRHIHCRSSGCAAPQRERQTGGPQRRQGSAPSLSLRRLFRARHGRHLHTFRQRSNSPTP
jgi:hypothetical protein